MALRLLVVVLLVLVVASVAGKGVVGVGEEVTRVGEAAAETAAAAASSLVENVTGTVAETVAGILPGETEEERKSENIVVVEQPYGGMFGNVKTNTASIGNIIYSVFGFALGGLLLFVSLFDPTRKEVITFFDTVFGTRQKRQRREATMELEARVTDVFNTFTSAVDKMDMIAKASR